jgi:SAM-dependent methyltransferase
MNENMGVPKRTRLSAARSMRRLWRYLVSVPEQDKVFWRTILDLYANEDAYTQLYAGWKIKLDPIYQRIDPLAPGEGTIVDLGCGYGLISLILALKSAGRRVIGVDRDARKIEVARRAAGRVGNASFLLQDFRTWQPVPADCVLLVDVLHYWRPEGQEEIIASACGCLGAGGMVILREGCRSKSWGHRMVHWGEVFTTWTAQNRAGDGLYFQPEGFYTDVFSSHGLRITKRIKELGPGSNVVLIFRKQDEAVTSDTPGASPGTQEL